MDEVAKTRETDARWRFDYHIDAPFWKVSEAYHEVDRIMESDGYINDRTKFVTREDKTFTLWQSYVKDPFK